MLLLHALLYGYTTLLGLIWFQCGADPSAGLLVRYDESAWPEEHTIWRRFERLKLRKSESGYPWLAFLQL